MKNTIYLSIPLLLVLVTCEPDSDQGSAPVANFSASRNNIFVGETIQFTDESTNNPKRFLWTFGDNTTSTFQNPSKTYSTADIYTVSLRATNSFGSNTKTLTNYITVSEVKKGSSTLTYAGNTYKTIIINYSEWMAENLAYLPSVYPPAFKIYSDEARYYVYDYKGTDVAAAKKNANYSTYGVLYNGHAAMAACPPGWHLPSDTEWKQLEMALGMTPEQADLIGWRGFDQGKQMKASSGWNSNGISRYYNSGHKGFSVRCVRD